MASLRLQLFAKRVGRWLGRPQSMQFRAVAAQAVRNSLRDATGSTLGLVLLVSYRPLAQGRVPKAYSHGEHSAKGSLGSLHSQSQPVLPSSFALCILARPSRSVSPRERGVEHAVALQRID